MYAIETKNLTKYYHKKIRGIDHLNLSVPEGEMFGFIGPNGAGKSTTVRILLGLLRPDGGTASVLGKDIRKDHLSILEEIGYMPSEASFYTGMKVAEVLALSAGLHRKDCRKEAALLCDRLQLDMAKRVEELSLGNRKKTSIVCALQHRPKLYILDEPTSGLDPLIQKEFFMLLEERRAEGATVFLSSHVLSEIQRHCDRAAIIRDGQIITAGKMEELSSAEARRVTVHGISTLSAMSEQLHKSVRDLRCTNGSVSFLYQGKMRALLSELAALPLTDLTVTEPDLEEIFLHYYS